MNEARKRAPWWSDDEYIVVGKLNWGDKARLEDEAFEVVGTSAMMRTGTYRLLAMELAIPDWHLTGERFEDDGFPEGKPVPLNRANIRKLTLRDGSWIYRQVQEHNPGVEDEDLFRGADEGMASGRGADAGEATQS